MKIQTISAWVASVVFVAAVGCDSGNGARKIDTATAPAQAVQSPEVGRPLEGKFASAELFGETGASPRWGSGWIDLASSINVAAGDRLRLKIGGTAKKVVVRLLPLGGDPNTSFGVVGGVLVVPANRVLEVPIEGARENIVQISVHGRQNPFGKFPLGANNGPASIENAVLLRAVR